VERGHGTNAFRRHNGTVLIVEPPGETPPPLASIALRQPGISCLDVRAQVADPHPNSHVAVTSEVDAHVEPDADPILVVPRDHDIIADETQCLTPGHRRADGKERGRPE